VKYIENGAAAALRFAKVLRPAAAGLLIAASVCGVAAAQTAPSPPNSTPATGAAPGKTDPGDKVICHYEEGDTGSLLNSRKKVCHTKREWDEINRDAANYVNTQGREPGRPK
jgi:hypothetical protein